MPSAIEHVIEHSGEHAVEYRSFDHSVSRRHRTRNVSCSLEHVHAWPEFIERVNDAGCRSYYRGLTMLATVHIIVD